MLALQATATLRCLQNVAGSCQLHDGIGSAYKEVRERAGSGQLHAALMHKSLRHDRQSLLAEVAMLEREAEVGDTCMLCFNNICKR